MSHPADAAAAPIAATTHEQALHAACAQIGMNADNAELIRLAENAIYRLPGHLVARVSRPGQLQSARREVTVSTWLQGRGFPVVRARSDLPQPIEVAGRAVTFWEELPPHTRARPADIGSLLRRLHAMPTDGIALPPTDPFVQIETRINSLTFLEPADREWLLSAAAALRALYADRPPGSPNGLVHGDPWAGNVVITDDGPILLDLERFSLGPPEYDLVVVAASYTSYGLLTADQYHELTAAYGRDVTTWAGYPLLRDIRELRVATYAGQVALDHPEARDQAVHRMRCLQGRHGPRPWPGWRAVP
jgi:aminoglycoside phosphotransferase (APT) family kinase protein